MHYFGCNASNCDPRYEDIVRPYFLNKEFKLDFKDNYVTITNPSTSLTLTKFRTHAQDNTTYQNTVNYGTQVFALRLQTEKEPFVLNVVVENKHRAEEIRTEREKAKREGRIVVNTELPELQTHLLGVLHLGKYDESFKCLLSKK